jgi:glycosyltransferase involved in cell wall biosynthesis
LATTRPPLISLVLPARDEATIIQDSIRSVAAVLESLEPSYEIIVGDSGSRDGTGDRARALGLERVRVVREELPGKGRVLTRALGEARGRIIGFLDADLEIPPETLIPLLEVIRGGAHAAIAAKTPETDARRSVFRRALTRTYNAGVALLLGSSLPDHQAGCKLFWAPALRSVLPDVVSTGWLWDTEVLMRLLRRRARIEAIPCRPGPVRPSRVRPGSIAWVPVEFLGIWTRIQLSRFSPAPAPLDAPDLSG